MSLSKINPTKTQAWSKLLQHRQQMKDVKMNDLFLNDASRYEKFNCSFNNDILVDFSKNRITKETIDSLTDSIIDLLNPIKEAFINFKDKALEFIGKKWTSFADWFSGTQTLEPKNNNLK